MPKLKTNQILNMSKFVCVIFFYLFELQIIKLNFVYNNVCLNPKVIKSHLKYHWKVL